MMGQWLHMTVLYTQVCPTSNTAVALNRSHNKLLLVIKTGTGLQLLVVGIGYCGMSLGSGVGISVIQTQPCSILVGIRGRRGRIHICHIHFLLFTICVQMLV